MAIERVMDRDLAETLIQTVESDRYPVLSEALTTLSDLLHPETFALLRPFLEEIRFQRLAALELPEARAERVAVSNTLDRVRRTFDEYMTRPETPNHGSECDPVCVCWQAPYVKVAKDL